MFIFSSFYYGQNYWFAWILSSEAIEQRQVRHLHYRVVKGEELLDEWIEVVEVNKSMQSYLIFLLYKFLLLLLSFVLTWAFLCLVVNFCRCLKFGRFLYWFYLLNATYNSKIFLYIFILTCNWFVNAVSLLILGRQLHHLIIKEVQFHIFTVL